MIHDAMDLLYHSGDDSAGEEDCNHGSTTRTIVKKDDQPRKGLRNITLITETEWNAFASFAGEETTVPSAGRWATHCSCPIQLSRSERHRAWAAIRATCDWIERRHPTYRGHCIPFIPMPPPRNRRKHSKRRRRGDASPVVTSSKSRVDSTLHISLTRPDISLHTNHVDSFGKLLTREIQMVAHVAPFSIQLQYTNVLELFHNENRTKSYGIWRCFESSSSSSLEQLTHCCDTILEQYQQSPYRYAASRSKDDAATVPPIFHVSLVRFEPVVLLTDHPSPPIISDTLLCRGESNTSFEEVEEDADSSVSNSSEGSHDMQHLITEVTCRFGGAAKMHHIPLLQSK